MTAARASSEELDELAARVREIVAGADDPSERLALRRRFYQRHAREDRSLGHAEIEFTRWLIRRGVLERVERGGSAWWRRIQARLTHDAELASLLSVAGLESDPSASVGKWLDFLARPDPRTWYRAHNASVVLGYAEAFEDVLLEPPAERRLVRAVLARILFAQSIVEGPTWGRLGAMVADPRGASVSMSLQRAALYPRVYPASETPPAGTLARLESALVASVDRYVIDRCFDVLVERASEWLDVPSLPAICRRYEAVAPAREPRRA